MKHPLGVPFQTAFLNPRRSGAAKAEPQNPGAKGVKGIDLDTRFFGLGETWDVHPLTGRYPRHQTRLGNP
jgi:hypothetical protein